MRVAVGDGRQECRSGIAHVKIVEWKDTGREVIWRSGWDDDKRVWNGALLRRGRSDGEAQSWPLGCILRINEVAQVCRMFAFRWLTALLVKRGESVASGGQEKCGERDGKIMALSAHSGDGRWVAVSDGSVTIVA